MSSSSPGRPAADLALELAPGLEADVAEDDVGGGGEIGHRDPRHQEDREGGRVCKVGENVVTSQQS